MGKCHIRRATREDLDALMEIYAIARQTMRQSGNLHQWTGGYPSRCVLEEDLEHDRLYLLAEQAEEGEGQIEGAFVFFIGVEPTYGRIEGAWQNDAPYGVIHRVASAGRLRGVMEQILSWCREKTSELRIDTHHDNRIMQHKLEKNGFVRCGIIYLESGDPRIAYQYSEKAEEKRSKPLPC